MEALIENAEQPRNRPPRVLVRSRLVVRLCSNSERSDEWLSEGVARPRRLSLAGVAQLKRSRL